MFSDLYVKGKIVGEGASSKVYEITSKESNKVFVCKYLKAFKENEKKEIEKEITFYQKFNETHPNILTIKEVYKGSSEK